MVNIFSHQRIRIKTTLTSYHKWPPSQSQIMTNSGMGKENAFQRWWECTLAQTLWKSVWRFSKKQKHDLPYDPAVPLGVYPRISIPYCRDTWTSMFIAALFTIGKKQNQMRYIYSIEFYPAVKENETVGKWQNWKEYGVRYSGPEGQVLPVLAHAGRWVGTLGSDGHESQLKRK